MKTYLISMVGLFLVSSQAHASFYSQLDQNFSAAQEPTQAQITGSWSGRCFQDNSPNVPMGAALVAMPYSSVENGPIFPSTFNLNIFYNTSAVYFDGMKAEDAIKQFTRGDSGAEAVSKDGSLVASILNGRDGDMTLAARMTDRYIFLKRTSTQSDNTFLCYFFEKLN